MRYILIVLSTVLFSQVLVSCIGYEKRMDDKREEVHKALKESQAKHDAMSVAKPYSSVINVDGFYVSHKSVVILPESERLPGIFKKEITLVERNKISVLDFAERVMSLTGIPVVISPDVSLGGGSVGLVAVDSAASIGTIDNGSQSADNKKIRINYTGSLAGLLNIATAKVNLFWRYKGEQIIFYQYTTRTFMLNVMPGETSITAEITNSNSNSSGGGGGGDSGGDSLQASSGHGISISSTLSVWENVSSTVDSMLSDEGKSVVSEAIGAITVTDTPLVLDSIESYIDNINEVLGRQVMISFKIYNVELDNDEAYGLDWDLLHGDLVGDGDDAQQEGFNLTTTAIAALAGSGDISATILRASSSWSNSKVILRALNKQGNVSIKTSTSVLTLNNQPVPVQVANQTTYLASSSGSSSGGGSNVVTTTLNPGTITTGFSLNVLPTIISNVELLLQYSIDLSTLEAIESITSGGTNGQRIQLPRISTRNFMQRVGMRSGETLILTGFETTENSYNKSSLFPGVVSNFLGGTDALSGKKSVSVVVVTPLIMPGFKPKN